MVNGEARLSVIQFGAKKTRGNSRESLRLIVNSMMRFAGNATRVVAVRLRRRAVAVARRREIETHASLFGLNANAVRTFDLALRAAIVGDLRRLIRTGLRSRLSRCRADLQEKSADRHRGQLCDRAHPDPFN